MNLSPLRKLLWMIAALAALVLLAPLAASAHEGGHHRPEAATRVGAQQSHASKSADRIPAAPLAQIHAAQAGDFGAVGEDAPCTSGCCFGTGCCAGTIIAEAPALDPPAGPQPLVTHAPHPLASARRTSLLEPPNARV